MNKDNKNNYYLKRYTFTFIIVILLMIVFLLLEKSIPNEKSSWDYWESKLDTSTYWRNRNNPYHPAFYMPSYNS